MGAEKDKEYKFSNVEKHLIKKGEAAVAILRFCHRTKLCLRDRVASALVRKLLTELKTRKTKAHIKGMGKTGKTREELKQEESDKWNANNVERLLMRYEREVKLEQQRQNALAADFAESLKEEQESKREMLVRLIERFKWAINDAERRLSKG